MWVFSTHLSLNFSLFIVVFYKEEACGHVCFLSTISLSISFFIVVFYKEESLQIMCIFSPPSHTQSLSLHCCFLWSSLYINDVLSPTSLSQNWISFHFLFSMKKKLNISCVFFSHCCFLISCHHGMYFLDHLSLNYLLISFCLFSMKKNLEDYMCLCSQITLSYPSHTSHHAVCFSSTISLSTWNLFIV